MGTDAVLKAHGGDGVCRLVGALCSSFLSSRGGEEKDELGGWVAEVEDSVLCTQGPRRASLYFFVSWGCLFKVARTAVLEVSSVVFACLYCTALIWNTYAFSKKKKMRVILGSRVRASLTPPNITVDHRSDEKLSGSLGRRMYT